MGLFDFFKKDKQSEDNLKKGMKKTSVMVFRQYF